jgi:hypothetical protein
MATIYAIEEKRNIVHHSLMKDLQLKGSSRERIPKREDPSEKGSSREDRMETES